MKYLHRIRTWPMQLKLPRRRAIRINGTKPVNTPRKMEIKTQSQGTRKKKPIACRIRSPCNEMSKSLVTRRGKKKKNWKGEKTKNRTKISSNEPTLQLQTLKCRISLSSIYLSTRPFREKSS